MLPIKSRTQGYKYTVYTILHSMFLISICCVTVFFACIQFVFPGYFKTFEFNNLDPQRT